MPKAGDSLASGIFVNAAQMLNLKLIFFAGSANRRSVPMLKTKVKTALDLGFLYQYCLPSPMRLNAIIMQSMPNSTRYAPTI